MAVASRAPRVLDGEAILLRPDNTSNFDGLRSRQGQAEAILVAYDLMEVDGQEVRPEPLEERRKRLVKLLSRKNKVMRDGIQLSEAITGDGARIFRHACGLGLEGIVSKRVGSRYVSGRTRAWLKNEESEFRAAVMQASLFVADFGEDYLAKRGGGHMELVGVALLALLYFLPWLNALARGHMSTTAIGVFNLFLGWTFLGWVIALVWSFSSNTKHNALYEQQRLAYEIDRYRRGKS